jgi:hypothetical protein
VFGFVVFSSGILYYNALGALLFLNFEGNGKRCLLIFCDYHSPCFPWNAKSRVKEGVLIAISKWETWRFGIVVFKFS